MEKNEPDRDAVLPRAADGAASGLPLLTITYIVDLPEYQHMACWLLASIREYFPPDVRVIGYCPEHRLAQVDPGVIAAHALMGAEIRTFRMDGRWDPDYPHGNKILAVLEPRESQYLSLIHISQVLGFCRQ